MAIYSFLKKHYFIFLLLTVFVSYGLTLWMNVWKDDNAIFFKFAHIEEPAGYLGRGLLGEGTYKFSVTPYYFIYKLFGYENIWPYYLLNLSTFFLSVVSSYLLFKKLISEKVAKLSSFVYACGYIASEGVTWLASSMIISVSIIFTCLSLYFYLIHYKKGKFLYFIFALTTYFVATFLTPVRVHYLGLVLVFFDVLWFFTKKEKNIILLISRITLIFLVFYFSYVNGGDSRAGETVLVIKNVLQGEFYKLFSFFGTIGTILVPDYLNPYLGKRTNQILIYLLLTLILYIKSQGNKRILIVSVVVTTIWYFSSQYISNSIYLSKFVSSEYLVFIGGEFLIILFFLFCAMETKNKRILLFLIVWFLSNLYVYTSYIPTSIYQTTNRYLAHSFIPFVGILALVTFGGKKSRFVLWIVILLAVFNLYNNFRSNFYIVKHRSTPTTKFYKDLKVNLPKINKGDLLYFDLAEDSKGIFSDFFSVGQMPEETAIAWRYGIDRYDFQMFTEFQKLTKNTELENNFKSKIHSFYYSKDGLKDTTENFKEYLTNDSVKNVRFKQTNFASGVQIHFDNLLDTTIPLELELKVSLKSLNPDTFNFPYDKSGSKEEILNSKFINLAFEYYNYKASLLKTLKVKSSSDWQDRISSNLIDGKTTTIWQPDRVLWQKANENYILDFGSNMSINRLVWVNGFASNTPTNFHLEMSLDGQSWQRIAEYNEIKKIESSELQILNFDPVYTRFIRMNFKKTINDDAPGIAEVWPVLTIFKDLDVKETEIFLINPFQNTESRDTYLEILNSMQNIGQIQLHKKANADINFVTLDDFYKARFNGSDVILKIQIPAGGTNLESIKVLSTQIPSELDIKQITARYRFIRNEN